MPISQGLPENFHLNYTHGECLACGEYSGNKPFCESCERGFALPGDQPVSIHAYELKDGQEGYVRPIAVFEKEDHYYLLFDEIVKNQRDQEYFLRIGRRDGKFWLDALSIGVSNLGNPPQRGESRGFISIRLIGSALMIPDPHTPAAITSIANLREGQEGYTSPHAFHVSDGLVWVNKEYSVTPTPQGNNTVNVRKFGGLIEVSSRTLSLTELFNQPWPKGEPFEKYLMAILMP